MRIIAFILGLLASAAAVAIAFGFDVSHPLAPLGLPDAATFFTLKMFGELGASAVTLLGAFILVRRRALAGLLMLLGAAAMAWVFAPNSIAAVPIILSGIAGILAIYSALKLALAWRKVARGGKVAAKAAKVASTEAKKAANSMERTAASDQDAEAEDAIFAEVETLLGAEQANEIRTFLHSSGSSLYGEIMRNLRNASQQGNLAAVAGAIAKTLRDAKSAASLRPMPLRPKIGARG
jgi:hypothetical protein